MNTNVIIVANSNPEITTTKGELVATGCAIVIDNRTILTVVNVHKYWSKPIFSTVSLAGSNLF